jgi:hypothetical protein
MKRLFILVVILYLNSCTTSLKSIYDFNYPLTSAIAYSYDSKISARIPEDWFTAIDNECNCIDLWLIKNDYTQSLNLTRLNLDDATKSEIKKLGIKKLVDYSKIFVRVKLGNSFKGFFNEEFWEINGNSFAGYQYLDKESIQVRVIVFEHGDRYYEFTAISKESGNFEQLFNIQNSVLSSID